MTRKQVPWLLTILFIVGGLTIAWYVQKVQSDLVQSMALEEAEAYTQTLKEFRSLYTSEVVKNVDRAAIEVTHDYKLKNSAIPLPATLSILLGEKMAAEGQGSRTKLYSPYPFPWRKETGGLRDQFALDAWAALTKNPSKPFYRTETVDNARVIRYAIADTMRADCISCHNNHSDTPKRDWKIGDTRGILEVSVPLTKAEIQTREDLGGLFLLGTIILILSIIGLNYTIRSYQRTLDVIEKSSQEIDRQNWLKTEASSLLSGCQGIRDIEELGQFFITSLSTTLECGYGSFFVISTDSEPQQDRLSPKACYGFGDKESLKIEFQLGQGLIGQCAKDSQPILIDNVPDDYVQIHSSLGKSRPHSIFAVPILFEGKVIAAFELASFKPFTIIQKELVNDVSAKLGTLISNINAQNRTETLLIKYRVLNEEARLNAEALAQVNEELENHTKKLIKNEQSLQLQSEELRVTNEELENKTTNLEWQQKELQEIRSSLEKKAEELEASSQYKSDFLANMSHELRTPLNSLLILAKLFANNHGGNLTAQQTKAGQVIYDGGIDLLNLINDILDLSKIEAGKLDIFPEATSPRDMVENIVPQITLLAEEKDISFHVKYADELPSTIVTDPRRVGQVLKNLLANAVKFTAQGSVTLSIAYAESGTQFQNPILGKDRCLAIAVRDTGIGISEEQRELIFAAFQQAERSTSRRYGGTGLGLNISRKFATLLGGEIQLESQLGEGSCFTLYLPLLAPESNKTEEPKPNSEVSETVEKLDSAPDHRTTKPAGPTFFLIIDDDKNFAAALTSMIRMRGHKSLTATTALEGLEFAEAYSPNAIILDLGLPDVDGHRVLELLQRNEKTKDIPVQILSAKDREQSSIDLGAVGHLQKPITPESFEQLLEKMVAKKGKIRLHRVLLVEDHLQTHLALTELLKDKGIVLSFAENSDEALKRLEQETFDGMILDLGLGDSSGFTVLEIGRERKILPASIIIYTGQELLKEEMSKLEEQVQSVIVKDADATNKLLAEVTTFIDGIEDYSGHSEIGSTEFAGRRVFLVDDDPRNTFALRAILDQHSILVTLAENGKQAMEMLADQELPELILMDLMMPVMNGYQAIAAIRKSKSMMSIPIIALTANAMPKDREKAIAAGASDYLTKPIDPEKLIELMRIWLPKQ